MEGKRLIEKIRLRNILSFGDKGEEIELQPLNIIIGQNVSGKSNLVDVVKLLRSASKDKGLINFISRSGGINEWIWKGKRKTRWAEIIVTTNQQGLFSSSALVNYELRFQETHGRLEIEDEKVLNNDTILHSRKKLLSEQRYKDGFLMRKRFCLIWVG